MDDTLEQLAMCTERGKENRESAFPTEMAGEDGVLELTRQALAEGLSPDAILKSGMMVGMNRIGKRYSEGRAFVPDLLMAARAMYTGMEILQPFFKSGEITHRGTVIVGTVAGDLHDIGKNIVRMVLEGGGWRVIDLGVDVTTDQFLAAVNENLDAMVGMSALLTTTMANMDRSVQKIRARSPHTRIFIGGAPVTKEFCDKIGADGYFADPHSFVEHLQTMA